MSIKGLYFAGLLALTGILANGQPTNGAQYWSTTMPDCSSIGQEAPVAIKNAAGVTLGYSCWVSGTFVWLAAGGTATNGGTWSTYIRALAPASGAVGVDYSFYDPSANLLSLDTTLGSSIVTGNDVNFALYANQPSELRLLGAPGQGPQYAQIQTGSVYAVFYCPDADTCLDVEPQLIYSALPAIPWSLSVPIAWDGSQWTQWSGAAIDDGGAHRVSLVIYNQTTAAAIYTLSVYDSNGHLTGTGTTPSIPSFGTYGDVLSNIVKSKLPSGIFKVLIDGGANDASVVMLQTSGPSATTLQVGYDSALIPGSRVRGPVQPSLRRKDTGATPHRVFDTLPR